ncbi:transcription-repair coupling factor [Planctomycetota bacterium]
MNLWQDKIVAQMISRLESAKGAQGSVKVEGTWGSFARLLSACISKKLHRPILYICPHIDDADNAADDLLTFGAGNVETFPAWEGAEELADATDEIRSRRAKIALKMFSEQNQFIICSPVQAFCHPIPKPQALRAGSLQLQTGKNLSPEKAFEWLIENEFERVDRVDLPGQFARRGGIIDIFAPLTVTKESLTDLRTENGNRPDEAVRVEFFADTIESIRSINLDTQRSTEQIESIDIVSAAAGYTQNQTTLLLSILPEDTIIILEEPNDIQEVADVFLDRLEESDRFYNWHDIHNALQKFTQLHVCRFATSRPEDFLKLNIKSIQQFQRKTTSLWAGHKQALEELTSQAKNGKKVFLYCESPAEIKRLEEIIKETNKTIPSNFKLKLGYIHQGFAVKSLDTIVISHHELFGQYTLRRRQRTMRPSAPVDTLLDLQAGDYVVHLSYGIGKFLGVKTIKEKNGINEYLTIEYADGVKMQVSVSNINLVQKYIGTSPKRPKLSKIGSKRWQKQKEKVTRSVRDLAGEMLEIQAKRQATAGIAFNTDSNWQNEFEESFPYQKTKDQSISAEQIKDDMLRPVAMDRLLCGDVGYGKTELAMRASFKAVETGKQVALLVPTTVLCAQHGRTFTDRFADFPICIEVLNRFKTKQQARDILERTRTGRVDILIGTHRLFSHDVGFKDLGLLIIDEEQRFGVKHKEKLKKLRFNIDVLTMTATPIPRTLHMALLGLRDISSLQIPPLDRRSIVTNVTAYSNKLIKKGIIRELNRQGQVFFLHNRVKTIDKKAWEIQKLAPDTKVGIAHGQMSKSKLEETMTAFVLGEIDVLVCTTIIESGLDIPNANTIFINDADRFGLAELHQLRGRVGRYKHRAYAFILLPKSRPVTPLAAKRLKAIEEYSHLGAGFRIALRDLEIRGAGNILGPEQSGHIQAVGFQMYCELMAKAVRKLKNEPIETIPAAVIDLGFAVYIPRNYISSDKNRMEAYRKIATAKIPDDIRQVETELADVYGPLPDDVKLLLELAELRIKADRFNIKTIVTAGRDIIFNFKEEAKKIAKSLFAKAPPKAEVILTNSSTAYLRLPKNYLEPKALIATLRKILS